MYLQNSTVEVQFWSGNPRNNLMVCKILKYEPQENLLSHDRLTRASWQWSSRTILETGILSTLMLHGRQSKYREKCMVFLIILTDKCRFKWEQTNTLLGHSVATITWDIPSGATPGVYRIQHFGYHKPLLCKPLLAKGQWFIVLLYSLVSSITKALQRGLQWIQSHSMTLFLIIVNIFCNDIIIKHNYNVIVHKSIVVWAFSPWPCVCQRWVGCQKDLKKQQQNTWCNVIMFQETSPPNTRSRDSEESLPVRVSKEIIELSRGGSRWIWTQKCQYWKSTMVACILVMWFSSPSGVSMVHAFLECLSDSETAVLPSLLQTVTDTHSSSQFWKDVLTSASICANGCEGRRLSLAEDKL